MMALIKKCICAVFIVGGMLISSMSTSFAYMLPEEATLNDFTIYTDRASFVNYAEASWDSEFTKAYLSSDRKTIFIPDSNYGQLAICSYIGLPRVGFNGGYTLSNSDVYNYLVKNNAKARFGDKSTALSQYGYAYSIEHDYGYISTIFPILGGGSMQFLSRIVNAGTIDVAVMITPYNDLDIYNIKFSHDLDPHHD